MKTEREIKALRLALVHRSEHAEMPQLRDVTRAMSTALLWALDDPAIDDVERDLYAKLDAEARRGVGLALTGATLKRGSR